MARRSDSKSDTAARRQAIVDLLKKSRVASQAELAELLASRGFEATQATLSRDLKALGVGKVPAEDGGSVYVLPGAAPQAATAGQTRLEIEAFLLGAKLVGNLVVLRTPPGNAHGVGRVVDSLGWDEVAGSIAGDDTVLVICASAPKAKRFVARLEEISGRRLA